jgi:hypothetical protein
MAVKTKPKTTRTVVSKKKQPEGTTPQTGEMSDRRIQVSPDSNLDRGIGSSFAYAVGEILTEAKQMRGSKQGFLGTEKETIDVKDFVQSLNK